MRAPYLLAQGRSPLPSLGGSFVRPRPVIPVIVSAPASRIVTDGLLDSGSDEAVFEERHAQALGIDLTHAEERQVGLTGRTAPVRCRYSTVELQIGDGQETYRWSAIVGFVQARLQYSLLGHAGFLQFFDTEFYGAKQEVVITPNVSFSGTRT